MKLKLPVKKLRLRPIKRKLKPFLVPLLAILLILLGNQTAVLSERRSSLETELDKTSDQLSQTKEALDKASQELEEIKNQDQYVINQELNENLQNIKKTYTTAVATYEDLLKLKEQSTKTQELDDIFTAAIMDLVKEDYRSSTAKLTDLAKKIDAQRTRIVSTFKIPENVQESTAPPGSGYSRQKVPTDEGSFLVSIVAADLNSTRVIVDTASDSDCHNDCPVLSLASYASRNGAYAGVNGSYFCPASYPSCAGKTNTFDTLAMNKNKTYFNSDNNVYSIIPAVIFGSGWVRFVGQSLEWGRDTSVDSVLANKPLLVSGGNITFGGGGEAKEGARGGRSFVANKANMIYIGVVHNATVAQSAKVMHSLGMENALNLDNGGSTALFSGGYKVGPGRNLPNVILFVRK